MSQPDIILIVTDNQQAATLGCYGNPEIHTPHLDQVASEGALFENAFCPNAFCSPCRASILTGRLPSQHGVHAWLDDRAAASWPEGWHALAGLPTLPELLQAQGYRTGLFGKYHLGDPRSPAPGWERWVTMADGHVRSFYDNRIYDDGAEYPQPGHSVDFFAEKALGWMAEQSSAPLFAYIPLPAPYGHWPATNDGNRNRFADLYADCPLDTAPRQPICAEAVAHYDRVKARSGAGLDFSMLMRAPNDPATLRNYYSQITLIDAVVGRIRAARPGALIVFTADHGLSLGHHGFWGHGAATYPSNLHRAAHSVPLLVSYPGVVPSGQRLTGMASNMDLFATLLELAGAQVEDGLPSHSHAAALQGQGGAGPDEVYAEQEETRVLRTKDWLYFKRFGEDLPDALYDLRCDPGEARNLIHDPAHAARALEMRAKIATYFERHARMEADMWRGGKPLQNTMVPDIWQAAWGKDWAPVFRYHAP